MSVPSTSARPTLAAFLREQGEAIVDAWRAEVQRRDAESPPVLDQRLPELLTLFAGWLERHDDTPTPEPRPPAPDSRPLDPGPRTPDPGRANDVSELVIELSTLRDCIVRLWSAQRGDEAAGAWHEQSLLSDAIERTIVAWVGRGERDRGEVEGWLREQVVERDEARERERRRLRVLTDVSAIFDQMSERDRDDLPASGALGEALGALVERLVPAIADWCTVELLGADEQIDLAAAALADSSQRPRLATLRRRYPRAPGDDSGMERALATGKPVMVSSLDEATLQRLTHDESHLEVLRALAPTACVIVPLRARGRSFGALTLATTGDGDNDSTLLADRDEDSLRFFVDLGRRAALSIDNARLEQQLRQAVEFREQTLSVLSHDLRNPLSAIDLSCALLTRLPHLRDDAAVQKQVGVISRSTSRMGRLVSELLDMSRILGGRLSLERGVHPLEPILDDSLERHRALAGDKDITLRRELDDAVAGAHLACDRERIQQVLTSLLDNAVKFSGQHGTVTLSARPAPDDADEVLIEVTDDGPGIPPEALEHIFDLYWQGEHNGARGSGVGLFMARGVVEAHGHQLHVDSEVGRGSRFWFTLPTGSPDQDA